MSQAADNLRDLLSLARMLRRFAQENTDDSHQALFLSTAIALESRAALLAGAGNALSSVDLMRDQALHAPVDCFA
jgi:hypothetical protein